MLDAPKDPLRWPMVMLVVGVNGVGKTTTIGKLALRFQALGRTIMLCAADTFRAAAAEQLAIWAERAKVPLIRHQEGADPAGVVFDAVQSAKANGTHLLIVDTAGRLHNKKNLMDEMEKMRRVIDRELSRSGGALPAGGGRHHRPERPAAGQGVFGGRGRKRRRADQARRHGQGRRDLPHRARAARCRSCTWAWAKGSTICRPSTRRNMWTRFSIRRKACF